MNKFINSFRKDKLVAINFKFDFKNLTRHKKIIKKIIKLIKQLNNLIPSFVQVENKEKIYFSQHIFNAYIYKYGCPCSLFVYKLLLKKYKANKYELKYYREIYAYYLLKYISKTNLYIHFADMLTLFFIIKQKKNLQHKHLAKNTKLCAISNGSFLFVACNNGYNYLQIDNRQITNFSHSLTKNNAIKLEIENKNMLKDAQINIYKNHTVLTFELGCLDIRLADNLLVFDIKLQKKCDFSLIFDKNSINSYKLKNKSFVINNNLEVKNFAKNYSIINNSLQFGFYFMNKKETVVTIQNENFVYTNFDYSQHKKLQQELLSFYSTNNYKLDSKELKQLYGYNINKQICCLPLLSKFNFFQTQKNNNINNYLLIERLKFNSYFSVPQFNVKHLFTDGKLYLLTDIFKGVQTILLTNASVLYFDLKCVNYYFSNTSKFIKIYLPTITKSIYINFSISVIKVEKELSFLKINIKNNSNILLTISFERNNLKVENIYKYFLQCKGATQNSCYIDFNQQFFNQNMFLYEINNVNFFSEDFFILYCLANKINIFNDNISNFNSISEIMYIFLNYSNWQTKHKELIQKYINYSNNKPNFFQIALCNHKSILLSLKSETQKHKIVEKINQYNKTIIDSFYLGNYKYKKYISSFYYCFIYLMFVNNIIIENNIKLIDKNMFCCIKNFKIKLSDGTYFVNLVQKNNRNYCVNNVNYIGFSHFRTNNTIDIII